MFYFILGIIFALFFQPIIEGLTALVLSYFELLKSKIAVGIGNNNKKLEGSSHSIGFAVPDEPEEEEDDDEE